MRGFLYDAITLSTLSAEIFDIPVEKCLVPWLLSERLYTRKCYAHPELLQFRVLVKVRATIKSDKNSCASVWGKDKKSQVDDDIYECKIANRGNKKL